ncbi:hypothetical protein LNKW23_30840 [Paralimibaculum aggregatum]|uniref:DUF922 domain-containing protein n=1 Tax=Paralimibaculum aggregatum TaxID=3036245 RepID=A0ABQ6LNL5_9RHOB|nr:DUF922 domain-containing protein [Limibaculum sp. NKW23]GMG83870.1 hypothetical protein LNKW23_30840 [Limibaculum sp. NKW23]
MKGVLKLSKPSVKEYKVSGKVLKDVLNVLNKRKWWGRYQSHESAAYAADAKAKPKIGTITVTAKPTIDMPKWSDYANADDREKKSWDAMVKNLRAHEDEHHKIFKEAAEYFCSELQYDDPMEKKDAVKKFNTFKKDTQKEQDSFDKGKDSCANIELVYYDDAQPKK